MDTPLPIRPSMADILAPLVEPFVGTARRLLDAFQVAGLSGVISYLVTGIVMDARFALPQEVEQGARSALEIFNLDTRFFWLFSALLAISFAAHMAAVVLHRKPFRVVYMRYFLRLVFYAFVLSSIVVVCALVAIGSAAFALRINIVVHVAASIFEISWIMFELWGNGHRHRSARRGFLRSIRAAFSLSKGEVDQALDALASGDEPAKPPASSEAP